MKKPVTNDAPGMRGSRSRNENGALRRLNSNENVGTFEETYKIDTGRRRDMHIGTLMAELGVTNVTDLLAKLRAKNR